MGKTDEELYLVTVPDSHPPEIESANINVLKSPISVSLSQLGQLHNCALKYKEIKHGGQYLTEQL